MSASADHAALVAAALKQLVKRLEVLAKNTELTGSEIDSNRVLLVRGRAAALEVLGSLAEEISDEDTAISGLFLQIKAAVVEAEG